MPDATDDDVPQRPESLPRRIATRIAPDADAFVVLDAEHARSLGRGLRRGDVVAIARRTPERGESTLGIAIEQANSRQTPPRARRARGAFRWLAWYARCPSRTTSRRFRPKRRAARTRQRRRHRTLGGASRPLRARRCLPRLPTPNKPARQRRAAPSEGRPGRREKQRARGALAPKPSDRKAPANHCDTTSRSSQGHPFRLEHRTGAFNRQCAHDRVSGPAAGAARAAARSTWYAASPPRARNEPGSNWLRPKRSRARRRRTPRKRCSARRRGRRAPKPRSRPARPPPARPSLEDTPGRYVRPSPYACSTVKALASRLSGENTSTPSRSSVSVCGLSLIVAFLLVCMKLLARGRRLGQLLAYFAPVAKHAFPRTSASSAGSVTDSPRAGGSTRWKRSRTRSGSASVDVRRRRHQQAPPEPNNQNRTS